MSPAKRNITLISANHHLLSCPDNSSFLINPCITAGAFATPADRLDFFNLVCPRKQPLAALEKILLEISTQAVADDRNPEVIHDVNKKLNIGLPAELRFINNETVILFKRCIVHLNQFVKNPRLKSRASDSPSGFFSLATRLHLPFYLLSCFICPMHLPSGRVLLRLSVSILTLPVLLRCRLFKWTFTTAPTLPRGTAASLSSHSRFRSACLYVTGFARYLVNSYF